MGPVRRAEPFGPLPKPARDLGLSLLAPTAEPALRLHRWRLLPVHADTVADRLVEAAAGPRDERSHREALPPPADADVHPRPPLRPTATSPLPLVSIYTDIVERVCDSHDVGVGGRYTGAVAAARVAVDAD